MTIQTDVFETKSWLKQHEYLIIGILSLIVVLYLGHLYLSHKYEIETKAVSESAQTLKTQQETNQRLQSTLQAQQSQYNTLSTTLTQQNSQLQAQIVSATQKAAAQQVADTKLTNQQLVDRLNSLTGEKIVATDSGASLNHDQTLGVTTKLEDLPALTQQISIDKQIISNKDSQLQALTNVASSDTVVIGNLNTTLVDQKTSYEAQLKLEKTKSLRSKFKYAIIGAGVGAVIGVVEAHKF